MQSLESLLRSKTFLVADGAWSTALQARGLPIGDAAEAWNLTHEDAVRSLARDYATIPVDVLTTNTFAVNDAQCLTRGIAIARDESADAALVAVALGPGITDAALFQQIHDAGARVCVLETQLDVAACAGSIAAARAVGLEVIASFTFFRASDGSLHTRCGTDPAQAAARAGEAGTAVVGANCCDGPATVRDAIATMHAAHPGIPLWAKPNAGVPHRTDDALVYPYSPADMADWTRRIAVAGASIVGGCCGCGPAHIAGMAAALRGTTRP